MKILVSVQSLEEAEEVLESGKESGRFVDFLDFKNPAAGALGAVDPAIVENVVLSQTEGDSRFLISMACGEWIDRPPVEVPNGVQLAKLGSAGWKTSKDKWMKFWESWRKELPSGCSPVLVSYADFEECGSMDPESAIRYAGESDVSFVLVDTFNKNSPGLLGLFDHPKKVLRKWIELSKEKGVTLALAGKLTANEVRELKGIGAEVVGVRSAICESDRKGRIDRNKVKGLLEDFA